MNSRAARKYFRPFTGVLEISRTSLFLIRIKPRTLGRWKMTKQSTITHYRIVGISVVRHLPEMWRPSLQSLLSLNQDGSLNLIHPCLSWISREPRYWMCCIFLSQDMCIHSSCLIYDHSACFELSDSRWGPACVHICQCQAPKLSISGLQGRKGRIRDAG